MEFKISTSENGEYLVVEVFKPITGDLERGFIKKSIEEMKVHDIKKVFVDVSRVPNIEGVFENYKSAYYEMELLDHPTDAKIAVFVSPDDDSHDFAQTLYRNAGYNFSIFQDKSSAIKWLNK